MTRLPSRLAVVRREVAHHVEHVAVSRPRPTVSHLRRREGSPSRRWTAIRIAHVLMRNTARFGTALRKSFAWGCDTLLALRVVLRRCS